MNIYKAGSTPYVRFDRVACNVILYDPSPNYTDRVMQAANSYITKQACLANLWQPAESCLVTPAQQQTKLIAKEILGRWTKGTVR